MPIHFIKGDATKPQSTGNKVIVHICNDVGGWGKGFVLAISKRWPEPEAEYRKWFAGRKDNDFVLGAVQFIQVEPDIFVANLIGQHKMSAGKDGPPIRYAAVETGLATVAAKVRELSASVHMPRIGCGLAGGKWDEIEPIIERTICSIGATVTVYDFP